MFPKPTDSYDFFVVENNQSDNLFSIGNKRIVIQKTDNLVCLCRVDRWHGDKEIEEYMKILPFRDTYDKIYLNIKRIVVIQMI